MKKWTWLKPALAVSVGAFLAVGCVYHERVVYRQAPPPAPAPVEQEVIVSEPPPPPVVETVVVVPGPGYVWVGGAWVWRGHWVWAPGYWGRPPHVGAVWMPHRYVYRNGRHVYVRGGWR